MCAQGQRRPRGGDAHICRWPPVALDIKEEEGDGKERSGRQGAMPGVTKYSLVDDAHDLRLPMHNDEVFKHGVCFEAKVSSGCNRYPPLFPSVKSLRTPAQIA